MSKDYLYKKLDEDDILEIIIEYFQVNEFTGYAHGCIFGEPGKDLRFVGAFSHDQVEHLKCDLEQLDKEMDYNGDLPD